VFNSESDAVRSFQVPAAADRQVSGVTS
jgi:hypothetical protein